MENRVEDASFTALHPFDKNYIFVTLCKGLKIEPIS